ncbi:MAG TPA: molybdenum cofactor biosynthesis protein MoaE [Candidatus Polarisedimenticolia bacterium]|nr:molybdenum cofactor biosynthesis protein MoaE [Candidatus Polarisedimenticolia bacterium]
MSLFRLTTEPLDPRQAEAAVRARTRGAVATFQGVVRDHHAGRRVTRIEYSAYAPMAEEIFGAIAAEAVTRFGADAIAVLHRLGSLEVGDVSLVVAVGAVHRREAMQASAWVVDEIKHRAPIWKKEFGDDGVFWIEGPGECRAAEKG